MKDRSDARLVYQRLCRPKPEQEFKDTDDLSKCYTSWVEMELRAEEWDDALSIARRSVVYIKSNIRNRVAQGLAKILTTMEFVIGFGRIIGDSTNYQGCV